MSNFSGTHYNSGCESGWTVYFEESLETEERLRRSVVDYGGGEEEEEEGGFDLSMVSDASSGPRNGFEDGQMGFEENFHSLRRHGSKSAMNSKRKEEMGRRNQQHSSLDDTASSPVFGFSNRETKTIPYTEDGLMKNVQDFPQSHSRKQHGKKQSSFYQSSSATKSDRKVSGEEAKWE